MFYVYKNTASSSDVIAEFATEGQAVAYMESKAMNCADSSITGFAVRDYALKLKCEYEI